MLFKDLATGAFFFDSEGLICRKLSETTASTPYCAKGMAEGFKPDEPVLGLGES
jgi:hypothetical protein